MSVILLVTLLFQLNSGHVGYQYFVGPKTFSEAKAYCQSIGTTLATILDDDDRTMALAEIKDRASPFIGLEHVKDDIKCSFEYLSDDQAVCPLQNFRCVPFWANGMPIFPVKGGAKCTKYDPNALFGNGGITNNGKCDTAGPFLCNADINGVCENEEFTCGGVINWCGNNCWCDKDSTGGTLCFQNGGCSVRTLCTTNNDCDTENTGLHCLMSSCCGVPRCFPLCAKEQMQLRRRLETEEDKNLECTAAFKGEEC